mmetsp:Transcript_28882/g.32085  ORF Transcript_28882/g.32085 Transcript_28882/m.32085 type:complete len:630 (-) Transcript_28882:56-1945(-)
MFNVIAVIVAVLIAAITGLLAWWSNNSPSIYRDLQLLILTFKTIFWIKDKQKKKWAVADVWEEHTSKLPGGTDRKMITWIRPDNSGEDIFSYGDIEERANKIANWAHDAGLRQGDSVALLMENGPSFVFFLLGFSKIGVEIALINTHLKGKQLSHCLSISKAKLYVVSKDLVSNAKPLQSDFSGDWFVYGGEEDSMISLDPILEKKSSKRPSKELRNKRTTIDTAFFIFTSGTTGMPKASKVKSIRFFVAGCGFSNLLDIKADDVIYCTLPLYHSAAGLIGLGTSWYTGGHLVLRKKFSARNFFSDCAKYNCTVIQYIGEICRYLIATEPSPNDKKHKVRLAVGNGLRPDIWANFKTRFNIGKIGEFYAATESPVGYVNMFNVDKSVGYRSKVIEKLYHAGRFVRFDVEKQELIRGPDGLCIPCKPNEVGEVLGQLEKGNPLKEFGEYTSKEASSKKIVHNVEKKNDTFFRTGDLLKYDENGNVFFVDRIGDTFRWKGENVATNEVGEILALHNGIAEAAVYGVTVGSLEGRAGMAAIIVEDDVESALEGFYKYCTAELPLYACPLFLRVLSSLEKTSTYKYRKVTLQKEGFDPSGVTDDLYFREDKSKSFVHLTKDMHDDIIAGKIRV